MSRSPDSWIYLRMVFVYLLLASYASLVWSQRQGPLQTEPPTGEPKHIAIIGAGAGGTSAAYHLRKYADFFSVPINITVFEKSDYVGGRSTTVNVFNDPNQPIELGASIFVSANKNLLKAAKKFGLSVKDANHDVPRESTHSLGVWDGHKFVFLQRETNFRWWNIFQLLWKYGWAPMRAQSLMQDTVDKFLKLYKWPYFPWKSLSAVAMSTGLVEATWSTGAEFLKDNHISEEFGREIIQASTRVNYGQNLPLIHGLETMVCMATDGAKSVEGGNWQIFRSMVDASKADLKLQTSVKQIQRNDDDTFTLAYKNEESGSTEYFEFDQVIISSPLQFTGITISPPLEFPPDAVPYVELHVTLLATRHKISSRFFRLPENKFSVPEVILTTLPDGLDLGARRDGVGPAGFWSISTLKKAKPPTTSHFPSTEHYVYKIFSPEPLTAQFVSNLFGISEMDLFNSPNTTARTSASGISGFSPTEISWVYEKKWHSYPYLYPRVTFEDLKLAPNLWYTSAIENFISTMETSSLSGMNVAALILSEWTSEFEVKLKKYEETL
ncbi:prenylcysteine lyase [Emydomyces testavorans]|uniref:Prenylcysteine lyase n=1 Tax=Emydomyces testavorans TaxID=2070801 RepID=A0AAF0DL66_9EURO|nr:prenylcysteine lyase [Emydomyces testavorans]